MIVLAINIGNTRTAVGIFRGRKLAGELHILSVPFPSTTKVWRQLQQFLRKKNISRDMIHGTVISSVVPSLAKKYWSLVEHHLRIKPLIISGASDVGLRIHYRNPRALGADRICSVVAAYHRYGGPLIVVDAGTATTYNVITKDGTFLGGVIAPGIHTASLGLHQRAAQLPNVELHFPKSVIGRTTIENIQSGILYGAVDAMEGMIKRIKVITGKQTKVVLTGGFSHLIKAKSNIAVNVVPSLVLQGAHLIYERVHQAKK